MPKPLQFRSGSIIYFQGDPADRIFILQTGKVSLAYQDIETGLDVKDPVQPGEFFGVKSALGRYAREENAMAMADTAVMAFTVPEFEAVAIANSRIIMKMLKVFSNQMRRVHKQVSRVMAKEEQEPSDGLFNVGEFYLKSKRFSMAKHVFSRYLTFYPSGKDAHQAAKNLEIAESSLARYGDGKGPGVSVSGGGGGGQPSLADPSKAFSEALVLASQGKHQEALMAFKQITDANVSHEWTAKSAMEIGRNMFKLNRFEDSLRYLTNMLTKYPKHPDLQNAMFIMGQCNEKLGRKDQASAFYKKILSMGGDEDITTKTKRALNALGE